MLELDLTLRDGRSVHVRAMRSADEAEVLQAFQRLSDAARYMRFMRVVREPDPKRLREVLASFPEAGIGLVATVPAADGIDIVGSAIAVFAADRTSCEFAITVASEFGGTGLATRLMATLIEEAKRRGLKQMEGLVLTQNQAMLRLARRLGFRIESEPGDPTVRVCRMTLAE
jgi:acetyltransferase